MDVQKFELRGHKGYRFKDIAGRGCSIQKSTKGLLIGINIVSDSARMHLDEESAMWLCRAILDYVDKGDL